MAMGLGRAGDRSAKVPRAIAVMPRHLQNQIAPRPVHPIKHDQMGATFDVGERLRPARVDLEGADGIGFARILGAVGAPGPGRADAADEIERGVEGVGQLDGNLAVPDAEGVIVVVHGLSRGSSTDVMPGQVRQ